MSYATQIDTNVNTYLAKAEVYGSNHTFQLGETLEQEDKRIQMERQLEKEEMFEMEHDEFITNYWDL